MASTKKVALVTGATKGIGKAIALGLAELGYQMILIGRAKSDLEAVSKTIKEKSGISAFTFQIDITDSDAVKEMVIN